MKGLQHEGDHLRVRKQRSEHTRRSKQFSLRYMNEQMFCPSKVHMTGRKRVMWLHVHKKQQSWSSVLFVVCGFLVLDADWQHRESGSSGRNQTPTQTQAVWGDNAVGWQAGRGAEIRSRAGKYSANNLQVMNSPAAVCAPDCTRLHLSNCSAVQSVFSVLTDKTAASSRYKWYLMIVAF